MKLQILSMIKIKRVYEERESEDGYRILVDKLWPRGMKKEDAHIDKWLKEIAPSTALRKWFHHDPGRWDEFSKKYQQELSGSPALPELKADIKQHKIVTLLYGAKDEQHNHAKVLLSALHRHPDQK
jgi:uncharacterized protein YeaO (DUF488 family)